MRADVSPGRRFRDQLHILNDGCRLGCAEPDRGRRREEQHPPREDPHEARDEYHRGAEMGQDPKHHSAQNEPGEERCQKRVVEKHGNRFPQHLGRRAVCHPRVLRKRGDVANGDMVPRPKRIESRARDSDARGAQLAAAGRELHADAIVPGPFAAWGIVHRQLLVLAGYRRDHRRAPVIEP